MVAQNTVRTYGVIQAFRFVEGIWLHRKSRKILFFFRKRPILLHTCAACSELPSYKINTTVCRNVDLDPVFKILYVQEVVIRPKVLNRTILFN